MIDTESSKKHEDVYEYKKHKDGSIEKIYLPDDNHVVIWTLSIRLFEIDICTLYGRKPSELIDCMMMIHKVLKGKYTYFYCHNLSWDWVYLRKFFFAKIGIPIKQLNTKSHYPIYIEFPNGIVLRDSLILSQRSLEKWGKDMQIQAKKAVGDWDYDKIRHQKYYYISKLEKHYAEFDTLGGTQCIDTLKLQLGKHIGEMPYTATGILREQVKREGRKHEARKLFKRLCPDYHLYKIMHGTEEHLGIFHGGYVHGNREYIGSNLLCGVQGYDFKSSYPFIELCFRFPMTKFVELGKDVKPEYIIRNAKEHAFIFKFRVVNIRLKDGAFGMPPLQFSKTHTLNAVVDNGRIIGSMLLEGYFNEVDLMIINKYYTWDEANCFEVYTSKKGYLPKWYRDIVFNLFKDKCELDGVEGMEVNYILSKYKLNATYGLMVQAWDKKEFVEVYQRTEKNADNEYIENPDKKPEDIFNETINKRSTILPFQWGCWVTSYAMYNLFRLGECCKVWLYSDTDSVYGVGWNKAKVKRYNQRCIRMLKEAGYDGVEANGNIFYLGIAETKRADKYTEYKYQGAKRYCGRSLKDGKLHLTCAGVPKVAGADCLEDDIKNFKKGFIFDGKITGKKMHSFRIVEDIYVDKFGNETGDSIDLSPCDYKLDDIEYHSLEEYLSQLTTVGIDYADGEGYYYGNK
ncbi:MAG: hypothetical protein IKF11_05375 [Methanobrevibacter sp.]|nr:hypothetical protein [Methanobrevibacter sp.]